MGPQPPLKRRPTHTPYTRPCKRDISAKLTPAGVGACTHTARSKKPSYHPPCGYIYIYTHAHRYRGHESIPHCHKSRHISTITDSFPPCVLRGLPTGIRPCFPRIFSVSNFSTLSLSAARSLFHLDASASFPPPVSHTRPSNRLREIQFRRFSWLTLSLSLSISDFLSSFDPRRTSYFLLSFRLEGGRIFPSACWKCYEHFFWIFFLLSRSGLSYILHDIFLRSERGGRLDLPSRLLAIRHYVGQMFDEVRFV